jgi:hypothetical protein
VHNFQEVERRLETGNYFESLHDDEWEEKRTERWWCRNSTLGRV